jgi:hypothetical protein
MSFIYDSLTFCCTLACFLFKTFCCHSTELSLGIRLRVGFLENSVWRSGFMLPGYSPEKLNWRIRNIPLLSIHNGILCSHEEERNVIIRW